MSRGVIAFVQFSEEYVQIVRGEILKVGCLRVESEGELPSCAEELEVPL